MAAPTKPGQQSPRDGETTTISLAEDPSLSRTLTVDHTALLEGLRSLPEPTPRGVVDTLAAADLLAVADGSRCDFGRATGAEQASAGFVEQVLAVPGELFTTAHRLIGDPYEGGCGYGGRPDRRKSAHGREAAEAVLHDHVLGGDLFDHLYGMLDDAPPALDPEAGGDVL